MLTTFTKLSKVHRLRVCLRHITRKGQALVAKISGSGLALALVATSIMPSNLSLTNLIGNTDSNLIIPESQLDETFKPPELTITIGKTEIKTRQEAELPAEDVRLSQGYHLFHPGVDLAGSKGTPVKSIMPGIVQYTQNSRFDYGNSVIVNHGNGITSLYAHLSKILVKEGDKVDSGTILGEMGATGHATGPHLHLEIRDHDYPVNPKSVITEIGSLATRLATLNQQ